MGPLLTLTEMTLITTKSPWVWFPDSERRAFERRACGLQALKEWAPGSRHEADPAWPADCSETELRFLHAGSGLALLEASGQDLRGQRELFADVSTHLLELAAL